MNQVMPVYEALLLDLDGVVIDSEPLHEQALRIIFRAFELDVPESAFASFRGMREIEVFEQIVRDFANGQGDINGLVAAKERAYRDLLDRLMPVPGALTFIRNARARYRLALTTSSVRLDQQMAFEKFGLVSHFEVVVTAEDIAMPKPHPQPYVKTAEKLGLEPSVCLVVEDSINGVRSAARAGCVVAGMTTSFDADTLKNAGAAFSVDTFEELAGRLGVEMR